MMYSPPRPQHFTSPSPSRGTHSCAHPQTQHPLPQLIAHFSSLSSSPSSSSSSSPSSSPSLSPPPSLCAPCQLSTETGVLAAAAALECAPDALVEHDVIQDLLFALLERCWAYYNASPSTPSPCLLSKRGAEQEGIPFAFDWSCVWTEWARAFAARRGRANMPELAANLRAATSAAPSEQGQEGEEDVNGKWQREVLRLMAVEAYRAFACGGGGAELGSAAGMRALEREAESVQSVDELEGLLVGIDERVG